MGPLNGLKVVEIASLAPAPFGCMILADLGADVLRITRAGTRDRGIEPPPGPLDRGRHDLPLDLKDPADLAHLLGDRGLAVVDADDLARGVRERERGLGAQEDLFGELKAFSEGLDPGFSELMDVGVCCGGVVFLPGIELRYGRATPEKCERFTVVELS